jgi:hypothetical protein
MQHSAPLGRGTASTPPDGAFLCQCGTGVAPCAWGWNDAAEHGGDRRSEEAQDQVDNVNSKDGGNSESYAIRRLKRDAPELAEQVLDGKMSANAAAVEAGFRTKVAPCAWGWNRREGAKNC